MYPAAEQGIDLIVRVCFPGARVEFVESFFRSEEQAVPVFERIVVVFGGEAFGDTVVLKFYYAPEVLVDT